MLIVREVFYRPHGFFAIAVIKQVMYERWTYSNEQLHEHMEMFR